MKLKRPHSNSSRPPTQATHARQPRRRAGIIFITAMWIILILCALVLVFAREMRVEVTASANRVSADQASTLELGAEQYVLAAVDASKGDAVTVLQTSAEQIQIPGVRDQNGSVSGNGYFWILQTFPDNDNTVAFGITDESAKLNINSATSTNLAALPSPSMSQAIADSIVMWRTGTTTGTSGQGADSSYYEALGRPYAAKIKPFESVDELYLVRGVDDQLLYGYDLDHNGVLDDNESGAGGLAASFNGVNGTGRGIAPFLTIWSKEPNTDVDGKARLNIAALQNPTQLGTVLAKKLPAARVKQIVEGLRRPRPFKSLFDFANQAKLKQAELAEVADSLTTSAAKVLPGLINVQTASQQVLMTLPGLTSEDAEAIVSQRANNASGSGASTNGVGGAATDTTENTDYTWLMNVLTPAKAAAVGNLVTGRSFFFSADIVAVSGNGRTFKRARIVVDARSSPPAIVYRKDLTYLGWPLDPAILTSLKQNQPLPAASGYGTGGANGLSQLQ